MQTLIEVVVKSIALRHIEVLKFRHTFTSVQLREFTWGEE